MCFQIRMCVCMCMCACVRACVCVFAITHDFAASMCVSVLIRLFMSELIRAMICVCREPSIMIRLNAVIRLSIVIRVFAVIMCVL